MQYKFFLSLPIAFLVYGSFSSFSSAQVNNLNLVNFPSFSSHSSSVDLKPMAFSPRYQPESAQYTVSNVDNLSLTTASGRQLPLKIYYPQASGQFPVIIFSHGAAGSKDFYGLLGSHWASNGYIVIHPTHADSVFLPGGQFTPENKEGLVEYTLETPQAWEERATDISLIIDSLDQIAAQASELKGKMDTQRIGVGGHSFGAYTAQLVGGATINIPDGPQDKSFADSRVGALLMLSPQGRGQQGLNESSWDSLTLPAMFMTGSKDMGSTTGRGPDWRQESFEFSPPGDKYLVFIKDANHLSFSGRLTGEPGAAPTSPTARNNKPGGKLRNEIRERLMKRRIEQKFGSGDQKAIFGYVKVASTMFWDAYLKNNQSGRENLKQKTLESSSDGEVTIQMK